MGYLVREDRFALGQLIWALQAHDAPSVSRAVVAICEPARGFDAAALNHDLERLINRHLLFEESPPSLATMMGEIVEVLVRHDLQLRKEFTLAVKAMGQGESIMRTLMVEKPMDFILDTAYTQLKCLLLEQVRPAALLDHAGKPLLRDIVGRLPALQTAAMTLLDDFQRGQLAFQLGADQIDQRVDALHNTLETGIRRVVASVLLVGLLLGSTLALSIPSEGTVSEAEHLAIRVMAMVGFTTGALLITGWLIHTFWQSLRKSRDR